MCYKHSSFNGIEKRPCLRFSEYTDAWQFTSLSAIGSFISGTGFPEKYQGNTSLDIPFYKVSDMNLPRNTKYMIDVNNTVDDSIVKSLKTKTINAPSIIFAKVGAAIYGERKRIVKRRFLVDNNMMAFSPNDKIDLEFCHAYFCRTRLSRYAQIGALPSYNASDLAIIKFGVPSIDEQRKIAEFIMLIDQKIEKQLRLLEHLKKYKRGVSKKLFDEIHNDSTCAIKQFSEVFELLQNNTFSRECLTNESSDVLNIHYGDILVKYGSVVDPGVDEIPYIKPETDISKYNSSSYLQNGDVVFADTAEDYTVGKTCEITNASGHRVLSGLHTMPYRPTINFVPMYLGYYFNSAAFRAQILPMIQGAKVSSISKSEMKKTTLHIPAIESQMKVVNILYTLDERIKRTELGLQELQQIKKGLLQNLFI